MSGILDQETESHKDAAKADDSPSATPDHSTTRLRDDEPMDASEQRRLWAMAATSAAHLITEFADRPIPDFSAVRKTFTPATPAEWSEKQRASRVSQQIRYPDEYDGEGEMEDAQSAETDVQDFGDPFYDIDGNDDDLQAFLDKSDQDLLQKAQAGTAQKRPSGGLPRRGSRMSRSSLVNQTVQNARKSLARLSTKRIQSQDLEDKGSGIRLGSRSREGSFAEKKSSQERSSVQGSGSNEDTDAKPKRGTNEGLDTRTSGGALGARASASGSGIDDDDFDLYDDKDDDEYLSEGEEGDGYKVAAINIDYFEVSANLEGILEDLQIEARITERYKYMLINKFGILLQALMTSQEREIEVIEQLRTKSKILTILQQFLITETEMSSKIVVEDKPVEEEQDPDMILDFHTGTGEGGEKKDKEKHDNQGLSIEEMSAGTIRETLLQQKNRLDVLEAIKRIVVLKLKQKEFEKTLLTLHYSRMVKPADLQKEVKDARRQVNDSQKEISAMHHEMGTIGTKLKVQEKLVHDEEKIVEKLELEALTKQNEVALLQSKPIQIQKEADREAQKLEQLQDLYDNLRHQLMESMDNYGIFQATIDNMHSELGVLTREEARLIAHKKNCIKETEKLMAQMENLLTREHIMLDRSALMQERIALAVKTKKKIYDEIQQINTEASKYVRVAQRLERSIKMATESFVNAKLAHEKMRAAFDAAKPNEDQNTWIKLSKMLEREIANLKVSLGKRLEDSVIKAQVVERLKLKLNELYEEQVVAGRELQELIRTAVKKRREREEKSEQCIKLDSQLQKLEQEVKLREIIIEDFLRAEKDLSRSVENYKAKSNTLKLERATIMNETVVNKQKLSDLKQVVKKLLGEIDELNQVILVLEKELKSKHYLILNARLARDSLRSDAFRSRDKFRNYRKQKEELLLGNKTQRRELEQQKQDVIAIRKRFETAVAKTNDIAIKVRERIEEICTFNEYIHAYDKILLKGAGEMSIREMERTKLAALYEELRKHVVIVKLNQPDESVYFVKIEELRQYFYDLTERRKALEQKMNEDDSPERVREINFHLMQTRENIPALERVLDKKEELLATRDAIWLERSLVETHINKITEDSLNRALHLKETYNDQVKSMVATKKRLSLLSRQIDGFISENSIAEAQAQTAEMKYLEFKELVAQAELNVAKGLAPTQEIKNEWFEKMRRKVLLQKARLPNQGFLRKVKPKTGAQILAARNAIVKRPLESPQDSVLGWNFSAVSTVESVVPSPKPSTSGMQFRNSAMNPRLSGIQARKVTASSRAALR